MRRHLQLTERERATTQIILSPRRPHCSDGPFFTLDPEDEENVARLML